MTQRRTRLDDLALFVLCLWALFFAAGAVGELLNIEALRDFASLNSLFLR